MIPALLVGLGLGGALMYLLDPEQGNRRRALMRDQAVHLGKQAQRAGEVANAKGRFYGGRVMGAVTETRLRMRAEEVTDAVLVERVRAAMGRSVSHPGAVVVTASDGHVVLSGPILERDVDDTLSAVERVRGVRSVENRLEIHEEPGNIPSLQ